MLDLFDVYMLTDYMRGADGFYSRAAFDAARFAFSSSIFFIFSSSISETIELILSSEIKLIAWSSLITAFKGNQITFNVFDHFYGLRFS